MAGSLSGDPPNLTYTARIGFIGEDSFSFRVNDGRYDSPDATVSIAVSAPPLPPTDISLTTLEIGENIISGGLIATLTANDPNGGDVHTFELAGGLGAANNSLFTIVGNQLRAASSFAGQKGNTFSIRLRATDEGGLSYERSLVLSVVEVSTSIVINEIHFNPPDNTLAQEFIELYNPDSSPAELTGWRLSGAVRYLFPPDTVVPPGGYLVVAEDPGVMATTFGVDAIGPFSGQLASEGETIRLRDQNDMVVDFADYRVGFPWPVLADGNGASIELVNPSLDNSLGSSWRSSVPQSGLPELTYLSLNSTGWSWRPGDTEASQPVSDRRHRDFAEAGTWGAGVEHPRGSGSVHGISLTTTISG